IRRHTRSKRDWSSDVCSSDLEQAQLLSPNVIFMDVKMPGIDGLEAIKQIYNYDSSIKFIMISAYDSFDYAKQAMAYGIKDYILKPRSEEHTSELQSRFDIVCRLLLEK